jgi:DNA polymerase-3 subunit beta
MEFVISRKALDIAVSAAAAVADPKASMPALARVRIEANDGQDAASFFGTDTYTTVIALGSALIKRRGSCTVDAKTFRDIVSSLPKSASDVTVELDGLTKLVLRAGKSRRQIQALEGDDFPTLAKTPDMPVRVTGPALLHAIDTVVHAAEADETRPNTSCVSLTCGDGKIAAAATDGHRGALTEVQCETGSFSCLLPLRGVAAVRRALSEVGATDIHIGSNDTHAAVRCGDITTILRLTEAVFPPIRRVIPETVKRETIVNRHVFLSALRGARVAAKQESREQADAMQMHMGEGELRLSARGVRGESTEVVDCDFAGKPLTVGFQPDYLIAALDAMVADEIRVGIDDELAPLRVMPANTNETTMVVMPQRI